ADVDAPVQVVAIILTIAAGNNAGRHVDGPADELEQVRTRRLDDHRFVHGGGGGASAPAFTFAASAFTAGPRPSQPLADEDEARVGDAIEVGDFLDGGAPAVGECAEGVAGFDGVAGHAVSGGRGAAPRAGQFSRNHD